MYFICRYSFVWSLHIFAYIKKFSQLGQGTLVQVSPSLIKRRKTHFHHLPCGATIILGNNGYVWICPTETEEMDQTGGYKLNLEVTKVETYCTCFDSTSALFITKSNIGISLQVNKNLTFNVIGVVCLAKLHKLWFLKNVISTIV